MTSLGEERPGFELGSVLGGRFRIDAQVTSGGFGTIFRAWHLALNVPVALKVLRDERLGPHNPHAIRQFLEEARLVAQLSHPNIVRAIDAGTWPRADGHRVPYIVFEWCEGQTLRGMLETGVRPADWPTAVRWLAPLVDALAYAHARGVMHRDLKPSNVMMTLGGELPQPRLLDFGIGKLTDTTAAPSERRAFSFQYAAPEQIYGDRTGPFTDVHALGLLLTELIVGEQMFEGADQLEASRQVIATFRPTPGCFGIDVGPLEPVLQRALCIDPTKRYSDARALKAVLDSLRSHVVEPVRHPPVLTDAPVSSTLVAPGLPLPDEPTAGASAVPTKRPSTWASPAALLSVMALGALGFGGGALLAGAETVVESPVTGLTNAATRTVSSLDVVPAGRLTSKKMEERALAAGLVLTAYTHSAGAGYTMTGYTAVDPQAGQGLLSLYEGESARDVQDIATGLETTDNSALLVDGDTLVWVMFPGRAGRKNAKAFLARLTRP